MSEFAQASVSAHKKRRFRAAFLKLWKFFRNAPYWLRTHTINKYHLVDARCARNGYAWGWIDRSDLFLYANFAILTDFVEKEYPGFVDWDYNEASKANKTEFLALYNWWKTGRKEEHDEVNRLPEPSSGYVLQPGVNKIRIHVNLADALDALDKKDNEMLRRLIAIRGVLWT